MSHQFKGTGVALVTPFQQNGSVDYPALEQLVNHVIAGGVNYLVVLGTTGESVTLTDKEKKEVLAFVIDKCASRVLIVCGIGGNNTAEIVHQVQTYDLSRVDGILTVAPYYNKPSQEGMYQHFKAIATATDKPIILYNVPGRTSSNILPATALRLANDFKNIIAIKEASGNLAQCMELVMNKPAHFAILSGDDNIIVSQLAIGMEGVISVAANCYTSDFIQMVNNALSGDYAASRKLLYKILPGMDLLFVEGNPAGVKCVLQHMGICEDHLRLPLVNVSTETDEKIKVFVRSLQPAKAHIA